MKFSELEQAIQAALRKTPGQPVLAALAGAGQHGPTLSAEFTNALTSLTQRLQPPAGGQAKEQDEATPWL